MEWSPWVWWFSFRLTFTPWHGEMIQQNTFTLPKTNSWHLKIGLPKRKGSSSNHQFSGASCLLVSGLRYIFQMGWNNQLYSFFFWMVPCWRWSTSNWLICSSRICVFFLIVAVEEERKLIYTEPNVWWVALFGYFQKLTIQQLFWILVRHMNEKYISLAFPFAKKTARLWCFHLF